MSASSLGTDSEIAHLRCYFDHEDARDRLCASLGLKSGPGGRYWCPFCQTGTTHRTPDLSTKAGFCCHKCGWHGDAFQLTQAIQRCDFAHARQYISSVLGLPVVPTLQRTLQRASKGGRLHPSSEAAAEAARYGLEMAHDGERIEIVRIWNYYNAGGSAVAAVVRLEVSGQGPDSKTYRPLHNTGTGWKVGDPPGLWPLYALPEIIASSGPVYVCEGEKAADAGRGIGLTCTTSAHGAQSPDKTDWSPLAGRQVVILPDNDAAGIQYANRVSHILQGLASP